MAEGSNIVDEIWVKVKRQDSSLTKKVRLSDEYCKFLKDNFPHYNERMVTVPVSFQYKDVRTHGIVSDDGGLKAGETSKDWIKATSGLRAEQKLFDEIQSHFSDQPCLLINGFCEQNLFKVVKSKLQQDKNGIQLSDLVIVLISLLLIKMTENYTRKRSFTKRPTDILRR